MESYSAPRTPSPLVEVFHDLQDLYEMPGTAVAAGAAQPHHHPHHHHPTIVRRATFPYVRHDHQQQQQQQHQQQHQHQHQQQQQQQHSPLPQHAHPLQLHHQQHQFYYPDHLVPTQYSYMIPPQSTPPPLAQSYPPVQHTDDAASKETQYLRRRCFNCHTTEPPSWRRSTLNPGKIVCNKCGLYERTHLRPRPLRFDELRAGNKARKAAAAAAAAAGGGPLPNAKTSPKLKRGEGITRRSSVSSSSDWDDNLSIYSSSSSSLEGSLSPPADVVSFPIRLPNNPLAELQSSPYPEFAYTLEETVGA